MEVTVKARVSFLGREGVWDKGTTRVVTKSRAHELQQLNLVEEIPTEEVPAGKPRPVKRKPGANREVKPAKGPNETK